MGGISIPLDEQSLLVIYELLCDEQGTGVMLAHQLLELLDEANHWLQSRLLIAIYNDGNGSHTEEHLMSEEEVD